jgi:hypothetical protein
MKDIGTLRRVLVKNIAATKNKKLSLEQIENLVRSLEKNYKTHKDQFQKYQPAWVKIEPSFIRGEESLLRLREFLSLSKELNNLNLFISLCLQDVMLLFRPPTAKPSKLEKNFEARLVALHCNEFTRTLPKLLGRLSKGGSKYSDPETLLRIRECHKAITLLRNQNFEQWEPIRHTCIGHRDNDAFKQLSIIESLDPDRLKENGNDFCKIMAEIIQALTEEIKARSSEQVEILEQSSNLCNDILNNIKSFVRGDPEWKV